MDDQRPAHVTRHATRPQAASAMQSTRATRR
jgi:hypothetical protein